MDANHRGFSPFQLVQLAPHAACGVASFCAFLAFFVGLRRLLGGLEVPLSLTAFLLTLATVFLCVAAVRLLHHLPQRLGMIEEEELPAEAAWMTTPPLALGILSAALLMLGLAVSLPGSSRLGLGLWWLCVGIEIARIWSPRMAGYVEQVVRWIDCYAQRLWRPSLPPQPYDVQHWPEQLTSSLQRWKTADGTEILSGTVRVDFESNQRHQSVHLAFCPPLKHLPYVELEIAEGPNARLQVGQLLPTGMRVDLKLLTPDQQELSVWLEFTALARSEDRPAGQIHRRAA